MPSSLSQMATTITERSLALINNDLKRILKEEGAAQTGNKATLQARIAALVITAVSQRDTDSLRRLLYRVQHHGDAPPPTSAASPVAPPLRRISSPAHNGYQIPNGYHANGSAYPASLAPPQMPSRSTYFFKESPFFDSPDLVMGNVSLEASPGLRLSVSRNFAPSESVASRLKADRSLRLLLFSALEQPLAPYTRLDVAFPSQIEVRINNEEVRANYKGLKNKPGSTRPVDITHFVRIAPTNSRNLLSVTYALTQKESKPEKYNLYIYLVKKHSVDELAQRIKSRNVITRQSVLNEMMKNANDPDIEVGSSVMSLKDPISTLRIQTPCRSTVCTHNQCFDAESFLQLQEQAPTWTCPICNKTITYESLAVDQYVEEILNKARGADQVTIGPSGQWSLEEDNSPLPNGRGDRPDESDEDLVEIPDYRIRAIKSEAAPTPTSLSTPPLASRETSTAPRSGQKRAWEVVDLTWSDDEEPVRPAKKVAYSAPSSLSDLPRPQLPPLGGSGYAVPKKPVPHANRTLPWYIRPPLTPPPRSSQASYRLPVPPSRAHDSGQGSASHPTYLGSSP